MEKGQVTRRKIAKLATPLEVQGMAEQVLDEMCSNAHNYAVFSKRWRDQLRPLMEFKAFLENREKDIRVEKMNEKQHNLKKGGNGNSKASGEDTQKKK